MNLSATPASPEFLHPWRDGFRHTMPCQIIHDSLHARPGWTESFRLEIEGVPVGYGSLAVGGPWKGRPTVFEFHLQPDHGGHAFRLFELLLRVSGAVAMEVQSNDPLLTAMLHAFARNVTSESILFHDRRTTHLPPPPGVAFRPARPDDRDRLRQGGLDPDAGWVLELDGVPAAAGGVLFHYNRPYGDVCMAVSAAHRRRGLGAYLVQELKRACREGGNVPGARCNPANLASRNTLQKAGFDPCGHILVGTLPGSDSPGP